MIGRGGPYWPSAAANWNNHAVARIREQITSRKVRNNNNQVIMQLRTGRSTTFSASTLALGFIKVGVHVSLKQNEYRFRQVISIQEER
jgi:hypothetical protein